MKKLAFMLLILLLCLTACAQGGSDAGIPAETPVPTPEPTPYVPDALIGEWTLCFGDGEVGDGSRIDSFSIAPGAIFTANGESSVGRYIESDEPGILNFVAADRHYLVRSVEKDGLALLYFDEAKNTYTSASPQIFYRDFQSAELTADNWQDFFELKTSYELDKNSLGRVNMLNVRIYVLPKESLDILSIQDGKITAEVRPNSYTLIRIAADTGEYSFSPLPKNKKELTSYGSERLQYAKDGFRAESEFHNFAMENLHGWAANIYARGDLEFKLLKDKSVQAAVEKDFDVSISSASGTIYYREQP